VVQKQRLVLGRQRDRRGLRGSGEWSANVVEDATSALCSIAGVRWMSAATTQLLACSRSHDALTAVCPHEKRRGALEALRDGAKVRARGRRLRDPRLLPRVLPRIIDAVRTFSDAGADVAQKDTKTEKKGLECEFRGRFAGFGKKMEFCVS
jgi:hypothetical protein